MRWRVGVEVESPLLLGRGPALKNVQTTLTFVPGGVLRGAIAAAAMDAGDWRRPGGPGVGSGGTAERAVFDALFTGPDALRFGCLFPVAESLEGALAKTWAGPLPASVRRCKADSDWPDGRGSHGLVDLARAAATGDPAGRLQRCPRCDEPLVRARGYLVDPPTGVGDGFKRQVKPAARAFVRVGLNRYTETAQDEILFVQEGLAPAGDGQPRLSFVGDWQVPDARGDDLRALLDHCLEPHPDDPGQWRLRLGTARGRGMGQVRLAAAPQPAPAAADLPTRLDAFQGPGGAPGRLRFSLTLRGPTRVLDGAGQPTVRLDREALAAELGAVPAGLELRAVMVETEPWGGWSSAWGLPKPAGLAMAPGGVLVYDAPAAERDAVLAFLEQVERVGLGERRAEGWGEVSACDPFHVQFAADMSKEARP